MADTSGSDNGRPGKGKSQAGWLQRQWERLAGERWRDVVIGQVGEGATNVVIGKNNVQINVAGRNLTLPIWLIAAALLIIAGFLAYPPLIEPLLFPSQMNSRFNIAIAEIGVLDDRGGVHDSPFGATLSKAIYDKLEDEYQQNYPALTGNRDGVLIWEDSMGRAAKNVRFGVIRGSTPEARAEQAARLAARINAHLVIYGYLKPDATGMDDLSLEFYVAGSETVRGEPDAVSGRHLLGRGVPVPVDPRTEAMSAALALSDGPLAARSRLIFWLTVGLAHETLNQQDIALSIFQKAKDVLHLKPEDGAAVLEYFIGREAFWLRDYDTAVAALEEAQRLDPTYANAGITLANVYYDRAQLFYVPNPPPEGLAQCVSSEQLANAAPTAEAAVADVDMAIAELTRTLATVDESPWPPIAAVGHLSLGNAYRLKGQTYLLAQPRDLEEAGRWFDKALAEFQVALASFEKGGQKRYVAWTHLGVAAVRYLQAFVPTQRIAGDEAPATADLKKQASIRLFQQAADEAKQCIQLSSGVGDLAYRLKVLDCGCVYYEQRARELAAQVQGTMEGQR